MAATPVSRTLSENAAAADGLPSTAARNRFHGKVVIVTGGASGWWVCLACLLELRSWLESWANIESWSLVHSRLATDLRVRMTSVLLVLQA